MEPILTEEEICINEEEIFTDDRYTTEELLKDSDFQIFYKRKGISYKKNNIFFIPVSEVRIVIFYKFEPIYLYETETAYNLKEMKDKRDKDRIYNIVKKNKNLFKNINDKIIIQNKKGIDPDLIRNCLYNIINEIKKNDFKICILTESFYDILWLCNFRLPLSSQIVNKHKVLNDNIYLIKDSDIENVNFQKGYSAKKILKKIDREDSYISKVISYLKCLDSKDHEVQPEVNNNTLENVYNQFSLFELF